MFTLAGFLGRRKAAAPVTGSGDDSLDAFFAESGPAAPAAHAERPPQATAAGWPPYLAAVAIVAVTGIAAGGVYLMKKPATVNVAPAAQLTIESDPAGAEVTLQGVAKGVTPLTLSLAPGEHTFEIVHAERRKQVKVQARADAAVVHHVQFDLPTEPAVEKPSRAARPAANSSKAVATSGATPAAGPAAGGPAAGWLAITSPIPLTVMEAGQVLGSTASAKIMLPAGKRELRLLNDSLGFAERRTVQVGAGKTATLSVNVPKAPLSINAVPWAEVWIDGVRVGETPIGNHMIGLGRHDIVFRHPTLGERHHAATVSLTAPARVSMDMRKE